MKMEISFYQKQIVNYCIDNFISYILTQNYNKGMVLEDNKQDHHNSNRDVDHLKS